MDASSYWHSLLHLTGKQLSLLEEMTWSVAIDTRARTFERCMGEQEQALGESV